MIKIVPECMPEFYLEKNYVRGIAYTSTGYLLPCCWLDLAKLEPELTDLGLLDDSLKLANNGSVEDIITSVQWSRFLNILLHHQNDALSTCKRKCGRYE